MIRLLKECEGLMQQIMNKNLLKAFPVLAILIIGLLLSSCVGALTPSYPGLLVTTDTAYIANAPYVYSINLADGAMIWRQPDKAENAKQYFAAPVLSPDGSLLLTGDYANNLTGRDPKTGAIKWTFVQAKGRWISSPLVVGNSIYAPSADYSLYALNLQGTKLWSFATKQALWATPVADSSRLYIPGMDHFLYALNLSDGKLAWSVDLQGAMPSTPVFSDGILYVATFNKELVAVDANKGSVLWRAALSGMAWGAPVLNSGVLYLGDVDGNVYAISAADHSILWTKKLVGTITSSPAVLADGVVFVTDSAIVTAFDFKGGTLWTRTLTGKLYTTPVVLTENDRVLIAVSGGDNLLVALDKSGNQVWAFVPPK
jgi:outer membrane protein assembly factor BamB